MLAPYTAIVLSKNPVTLTLPGIVVLGSTQTIKSAGDLHAARLDALDQVRTPFCFYLDDDDALPADYLDVLAECVAAGADLAYTNELVVRDGTSILSATQKYDRALHLESALFIHHLALMRTGAAQAAARVIPRGDYWTEMLLYFQMAKAGAAHVDRIGYHWQRGADGLSMRPETLIAQVASATWCSRS